MAPSLDNLIIISRFSVPGKTKTRLASALGFEGACDLHRIMAGRAVLIARNACSQIGAQLQIIYEGGDQKKMKQSHRGRLDNDFRSKMARSGIRTDDPDKPGNDSELSFRSFTRTS